MRFRPTIAVAWPIVLWLMLWITINSGGPGNVIHPNGLTSFIHGLRAIAPFFAVVIAAGFTYHAIRQHRPLKISWINPLTLSVAYGVVGLIALVESVDASVAFYWNALYLSVPLVLMAISADDDGLEHLARILNSTWAIMVAASLLLFMVGVVYLNIWDSLIEPYLLLECTSGSWHDWTDGKLRDTGVGRYAAIAGLLSLSGLWQPRLRGVWVVVLVISATLLLFTGARGSIGGFCLGAIPVVLLHSGRKGIVVGTVVAAALLPTFLIAGVHETFLDNCIFRRTASAPASTTPNITLSTLERTMAAQSINGTPTGIVAAEGFVDGTAQTEASADGTAQYGDFIQYAGNIEDEPLPVHEFLEFTGRTTVWAQGMELFRSSPII